MKLRRFGATVAATTLALTVFTAPATAQAQDIGAIADGILQQVGCDELDLGLDTTGVYGDDHADSPTTRAELIRNINQLGNEEIADALPVPGLPVGLVKNQIANAVADRALECGWIVENPQLPFGSSQIFDALPMLELLSSEFV